MRLPRSLLGASCGAAFAAWYSVAPETYTPASKAALCDAAPPQHPASTAPRVIPVQPPQAAAVSLAELRRWLQRRGVDISALDIRHAEESDTGRFGMFASQQACRLTTRGIFGKLKAIVGLGRGEATLATFPLESTITASTVSQLPQQGPILNELLEEGIVDERTAVILHLVVERLRGKESPLRPWIALLPTSFSTPLFWSDDELEWLKGTALYKATTMKKKMLTETWRRLEPVAQQLTLSEGVEKKPTYADFLWAYSIFWSRAIAMPVPGGPNALVVQEGIVPGLDFANHDASSHCRWTMGPSTKHLPSGESTSTSTAPSAEVRLVCRKGCRLVPGTEVTINYGNKSNEELLYLYGFAQEDNPHDVIMVACPLPPAQEWDEALHARVELLRARGLMPQVFLPAQHLSEAAKLRRTRGRKRGRRPGDEIVTSGDAAVAELDLPEGVMETLEVFVMEKKDVVVELEADGGSGSAAGRAASTAGAHSMSEVESSGLRLALLTTLVRLLELKVHELESSESGTGGIEIDEKLLAEAQGMSQRQRAALVYRLGQKWLARQYLLYTNALLQQEMRHLRALEK